jgi:hypothetical protein
MNTSPTTNGSILAITFGKYKRVVCQSDSGRRAGGAFEYRRRSGYIALV